MSTKISSKAVSLSFGILVILFLAGFYVLAAWTNPTSAPPDENIAVPINTGTSAQYMNGTLTVNGALLQVNNNAYFHKGVRLNTTVTTQPTCNAGTRGTIWFASSTADSLLVCGKTGTTYSWKTLTSW
jgi:hypothetical protein